MGALPILALLFILYVLFSWIRLIVDFRKSNIPGPLPLPFLGNIYLFFGDPTKILPTMSQLTEKYNGACQIYMLSQRHIILSHPKYLEPLFKSMKFANKGGIYKLLQPWLGNGLITSSGTTWKTNRKFLTPAFHLNSLDSFLPVFLRNQSIFIEKLNELANGRPINVMPIFAAVTFDNITESVMGISFNAQKDSCEFLEAIRDLLTVVVSRVKNPLLANEWWFNFSNEKTRMVKALHVVHKLAREAIEARRHNIENLITKDTDMETQSSMKQKQTFIDLMLREERDGQKIDEEDIKAQVNTIMFAGHDTVATALSFALYCISQHPIVQEKVLEEQTGIFGSNMEMDPTLSDLQKMKYLEMVIKESLRLYPSVPNLERIVIEDSDLEGLHIPKDTVLYLNVFEMHRNPEIYEDPLEFRPERFQDRLSSPYTWAPFSAGPRDCIGQKFAMMQMKVILSSLVRNFKVLPSGIRPKYYAGIILMSQNGVNVNLLPRF